MASVVVEDRDVQNTQENLRRGDETMSAERVINFDRGGVKSPHESREHEIEFKVGAKSLHSGPLWHLKTSCW